MSKKRTNGEGTVYFVEKEQLWRADIGWTDISCEALLFLIIFIKIIFCGKGTIKAKLLSAATILE